MANGLHFVKMEHTFTSIFEDFPKMKLAAHNRVIISEASNNNTDSNSNHWRI